MYESGLVPPDHPLYGCEPSNLCFNVVTHSAVLAEYEAMFDLEETSRHRRDPPIDNS